VCRGPGSVAQLYRGYGEMIVLHGSDELTVHHDRDASVVVLEYAVHGRAVSTGRAYDNHFVPSSRSRTARSHTGATTSTPSPYSTASAGPRATTIKADEADRPTLAIACQRPADPFPAAQHTLPAECRPARQAACLGASDQFASEPELAADIAGSVTRAHRIDPHPACADAANAPCHPRRSPRYARLG
jgi:hypothetical protein